MSYKKSSAKTIALSSVLLVALICCTIVIGAASNKNDDDSVTQPIAANMHLPDAAATESDEDEATNDNTISVTEAFNSTKTSSASQVTASCTISIMYAGTPVDDVTMELGEIPIELSLWVTAKWAVNNIQPVIWKSSDESVFIVDSETGEITTVGRGTAICSVTMGYSYAGGPVEYAMAQCIFRVK